MYDIIILDDNYETKEDILRRLADALQLCQNWVAKHGGALTKNGLNVWCKQGKLVLLSSGMHEAFDNITTELDVACCDLQVCVTILSKNKNKIKQKKNTILTLAYKTCLYRY